MLMSRGWQVIIINEVVGSSERYARRLLPPNGTTTTTKGNLQTDTFSPPVLVFFISLFFAVSDVEG